MLTAYHADPRRPDITFRLHFSGLMSQAESLAFLSDAVVVPSKRTAQCDNVDHQTKRAREAVDRASTGIKGQKVLLDLLGNARVVVHAVNAVLGSVGEVSQLP